MEKVRIMKSDMKIFLFLLISTVVLGQVFGAGTVNVTVATSGTPVRLSSSNIMAKSFSVQLTTGSASFCVGDSSVSQSAGKGSCASGTGQNIFYPPLNQGASYDLSKYYADASADGTVLTVNFNVQQ